MSMPPERQCVLFVDDEPRLLEGIVRMLRPQREQWEVLTAGGGMAALELMERQTVDLLVSDMRMPDLSGVQLLGITAERHPQTVRFLLTGQSDRESLLNSVGLTHRFLTKPCDPEILRGAIAGAFALREHLAAPELRSLICHMGALPSLPEVWIRIRAELNRPNPSMLAIGDAIAQDIGVTAKLLQLVNSACFGMNHPVTSPHEALALLGIDMVRSLVLAGHVFSTCKLEDTALDAAALWRHSVGIAAGARAACQAAGLTPGDADTAATAGLLHDCGMLILASRLPREFAAAQALAREQDLDAAVAEQKAIGTDHAALGAALLALWGLPDQLVEAVLFHHAPPPATMGPLAAVHLAQCAVAAGTGLSHSHQVHADPAWLAGLGAPDQVAGWQAAAAAAIARSHR